MRDGAFLGKTTQPARQPPAKRRFTFLHDPSRKREYSVTANEIEPGTSGVYVRLNGPELKHPALAGMQCRHVATNY